MKALGILVGVMLLLAVSGALTMLLSEGNLLPTIQQTSNPSASTLEVESYQAEQFFLLAGFIVFNMLGIAATLAGVFWFLNRGVREAQAQSAEEDKASSSNRRQEST